MIQRGKLFLVDFGIARLFVSDQKGTAIGTPGYAAPEQFKGESEPRSDLYSLGVTMHYLLTGINPEESNNKLFKFEPVSRLNPAVPEYISTLIMSMVEIVPDNRPKSAKDVLLRLSSKQSLQETAIQPSRELPTSTPVEVRSGKVKDREKHDKTFYKDSLVEVTNSNVLFVKETNRKIYSLPVLSGIVVIVMGVLLVLVTVVTFRHAGDQMTINIVPSLLGLALCCIGIALITRKSKLTTRYEVEKIMTVQKSRDTATQNALPGSVSSGIAGFIVGLCFLLLGIGISPFGGIATEWTYVACIILLMGGVLFTVGIISIASKTRSMATWAVTITSPTSAEQVLTSENEQYIGKIVDAINEAISESSGCLSSQKTNVVDENKQSVYPSPLPKGVSSWFKVVILILLIWGGYTLLTAQWLAGNVAVLTGIIGVISFILGVVGIIQPSLVIRWGKEREQKQVFLLYGSICAISFVLFLISGVAMLSTSTPVPVSSNTIERTVVPTVASTQTEKPTPTQDPLTEPERKLHSYYAQIRNDCFQDAYEMRSKASREKTDLNTFKKTWENNKSVRIDKSKTLSQSANKAVVEIRLLSEDSDPANSDAPAKATFYNGKVNMLKEAGGWRYNGGDFSPEEVGTENDQTGHWEIVGVIENQVPGYSGTGAKTYEFTLGNGEKVWVTSYKTTTKIINPPENITIGHTARVQCNKRQTIKSPGGGRADFGKTKYNYPSQVICYEADTIEFLNSDGSACPSSPTPEISDIDTKYENVIEAIQARDVQAIKDFVRKNPRVIHEDYENIGTPLYCVCNDMNLTPEDEKKSNEIVKFLISSGADVNAGKNHTDTPLKRACIIGIGQTKNIELLISNGADLEASQSGYETALYDVVIFGAENRTGCYTSP